MKTSSVVVVVNALLLCSLWGAQCIELPNVHLDWSGSMSVPERGRICWSELASEAPVGAYITSAGYGVVVSDRDNPNNLCCTDHEIYLSNHTHGGSDFHCIWNCEGGKTDEGADGA